MGLVGGDLIVEIIGGGMKTGSDDLLEPMYSRCRSEGVGRDTLWKEGVCQLIVYFQGSQKNILGVVGKSIYKIGGGRENKGCSLKKY